MRTRRREAERAAEWSRGRRVAIVGAVAALVSVSGSRRRRTSENENDVSVWRVECAEDVLVYDPGFLWLGLVVDGVDGGEGVEWETRSEDV